MEIGLAGLGRMGAGMARRWVQGGHRVVVTNRSRGPVDEAAADGAVPTYSLSELVAALTPPRAIWVMLPAGDVTETAIDELATMLQPGDTIVDGGNTNWRDDQRRAAKLSNQGINYVDQGTSGGIWGLQVGFCTMVGGDKAVVDRLEPAFKTLAPADGYAHVGPVGAGHYVKMVHNGIEYGMMQAYAEGFEILKTKTDFNLDLVQISSIWQHGSVVRSWLLELAHRAFSREADLASIRGWVADSGEGRWTVQAAIDQDVPAPVITLSLMQRFVSRQDESFGAKVLAALRQEFGGHAVKTS